ncbi:plasmid pRiA4b ORF-3 family protein [Natroniella sulfidigena]|uniref:plasmid pRiA4b ORF-3 family protein n=1 Tax=Natroniella sulfidigena TaxID=723921 RepID=UPI00200B6360|nr:plasmid pRiA4b ORF-3 family protein [Natroniella sulfidigena]MCK8817619.1 plasmid pRiA4b ORF-3 family protein [Natroniella sulfidigena]
MLIFNCTKKLRNEINFPIEVVAEEDRDDFYNWHVHLFRINRRKCVMLMNVATRYSIFLYGLKKKDFENFNALCIAAIKKNFKADRIDKEHITEYFAKTGEIKYTKTYNRSVISTLNNMKRDTEFRIDDFLPTERMNLIRLNKVNNDTPILTLEDTFPSESLQKTFREKMGQRRQENIYRFKVSLKGIEPLIWRRIEVPENYTFWNLHVAIQDAMGWLDYHLHEFRITDPATGEEAGIGFPDLEFNNNLKVSWEERIEDYFNNENNSATYIYDFGDYWEHELELEEINPAERDQEYPLCLAGERACPPEDCGGVGGYYRLLEILKNPKDEEYEVILDWLGEKYSPDDFDSAQVEFDDPDERLSKG